MVSYTSYSSVALNVKLAVLLLVTFLASPFAVYAAEESTPDKFKLSLGGYSIFRYDSKVSLTNPQLGAGAIIDPQDTLGLNSEQTVARISGYYRFNPRHALDFSYYKISTTGRKILENELEWIDKDGNEIIIPIGAEVKSVLDYEILKLGYLWSFHHTRKVELSVGAGLHVAKANFDLTASTTGSGDEAADARLTVPLPVFSFLLNYSITPRLSWLFKTEIFGLMYGDVTGSYTDTTLAMEYRLVKNFGLGLGLGSSALDLQEETSEEKYTYENRISGILLYATINF